VVALAVANVGQCDYCQAAHTLGGKAVGLIEQETIVIRSGRWTSRRPLCWWRWSASRLATSGTSRTARWQAALEAGWSDAGLTETSAVVALNLFTNYFNHPCRSPWSSGRCSAW